MSSDQDAVIVPLTPVGAELSTEDMLRLLLNREALVVQSVSPERTAAATGLVAQSGGQFAKALAQATQNLGRSASSEPLYRVITPAGSTVRDLVPAVGGGFRGAVRAGGSSKITGQARLVPVAAGAGATAAAGPLIATVALAVGADMLAQHQTKEKLDTIHAAVTTLQRHVDAQERSVIATASRQATKVVGYLLDQASIPQISSASHAFGDLDTLATGYIERLNSWRETVERFEGEDRVYVQELMVGLVGKREEPLRSFEQMVAQTYEALALRARVVILEKVAAEFANQDKSLAHAEAVVRDELAGIAQHQANLVQVLDDLNVMPVDSSRVPVTFAGKGALDARTTFARLARALHTTPDALPVLGEADQTMIELAPTSAGLAVVAPGWPGP